MSEKDEDKGTSVGKKSKKSKEVAGKYSTERIYRDGIKKPWELLGTDEDTFDPVRFPEGVEPAHVSVTLGLTLNLGDFESAKISVTCTLPAHIEELEEAYEAARDFAGKKLIEEKLNVDKSLRGKGRG